MDDFTWAIQEATEFNQVHPTPEVLSLPHLPVLFIMGNLGKVNVDTSLTN
jgi:hypothetical protein